MVHIPEPPIAIKFGLVGGILSLQDLLELDEQAIDFGDLELQFGHAEQSLQERQEHVHVLRFEGHFHQHLIDQEVESELHQMLDFIDIVVFEHLHEHARGVLHHQLGVDGIQLHHELEDLFGRHALEELSRRAHVDEGGDGVFVTLRQHVLALLDVGEQVLGYFGGVDEAMILQVVNDVGEALQRQCRGWLWHRQSTLLEHVDEEGHNEVRVLAEGGVDEQGGLLFGFLRAYTESVVEGAL